MKKLLLSLLLIIFLGGYTQANPVPAFWLFATNVEGAEDWFQGTSVTEYDSSGRWIRRYSLFGSTLSAGETTYSKFGSSVQGGGSTYSIFGSTVTERTSTGETKRYSLFGSTISESSSSGTTKYCSLSGSDICVLGSSGNMERYSF